MWKLEHNLIPNTIKTNFITNSFDIVTRLNLSKLRLPNVRLDIAKRSITFAGVKLWNTEIPSNIKNILSLSQKFYQEVSLVSYFTTKLISRNHMVMLTLKKRSKRPCYNVKKIN